MSNHFDDAAHGALVSSVGEQVVGMLMGKFLTQMNERLAILKSTLDTPAPDMAVVKQQAHDMTSSSGSVGLGLMCQTATDCEVACKSDDNDTALEKAHALVNMGPEVEAAIRQAYPNI